MAILKKDLQSLQKEIKALEKMMDKLIGAAGKVEKPKIAYSGAKLPPIPFYCYH